MRAAAKEAAAAEDKIAEEVAKATTRAARKELAVTAADIVRERDEKGLSWRQVGINLDIGSPSAARKAYTTLTGRPHYESVMKEGARAKVGTRAARRKTYEAKWFDDSDQDEIIEAITHRTIVVRRKVKDLEMPDESVHVSRIVKFAFDGKNEDGPLVVHIISKDHCDCQTKDFDSGRARCFRVADIKEVL
jgi:hypothetical protein